MSSRVHRICFLGYGKLFSLAEEVIAGLSEPDAEYLLYDCNMDTQDECVQEALEAGCTVFIASSGNAAWFSSHYSLPLVEIQVSLIDYAMAVHQAKTQGYQKVGILRSRFAAPLDAGALTELLGIPVRKLSYEGYEELMTVVRQSDCDAIVGAAAALDAAARCGKAGFDVYFNTDGIRTACLRAAEMARALRERRESREITRAIINNAQLGIIMTDTEGRVTLFNRMAQRYTALSAAEIRGRPISEWIPSLSVETFVRQDQRRKESYRLVNGAMMRCSQELVRLNGETISVMTTLYPEAHNRKKRDEEKPVYLPHIHHWSELTAESESMRLLVARAKEVTASSWPALITGEPGAGQEEIASCIHGESDRADYPCLFLDLATISGRDAPRTLFGYEQGEHVVNGILVDANHGSVILQNPALAQPEVLACLQTVLNGHQILRPGIGAVTLPDLRFFTVATEEELGALPPDLRRQLAVQVVKMPPLRSRQEDIPGLFLKYLASFSEIPARFSLTADMKKLLTEYSWPGNVKELQTVCMRYLLARSAQENITPRVKYRLLLEAIGEKEFFDDYARRNPVLLERPIRDTEAFAQRFQEAKKWMRASNDSLCGLLGISRTTLWRMLKI